MTVEQNKKVASLAPNLTALVGEDVCVKLIIKAGGLGQLAQLNDNAIRHLGCDEFHSVEQAAQMKLLCAGFIIETELFTSIFDTSQAQNVKGARKALAMLARKISLMAKKDFMNKTNRNGAIENNSHTKKDDDDDNIRQADNKESITSASKEKKVPVVNTNNNNRSSSSNYLVGEEEAAKLRVQFNRLVIEGKVQVNDEQALPIPEVHRRGDEPAKRKRGGQQEYKKRQRQGINETSVVEKALSRVKMGVSEEEQREELLQRSDIRVQIMKEQSKLTNKENVQSNKSVNASNNNYIDNNNEYDDLMTLTL